MIEKIKVKVEILKTKLYLFSGGLGGSIIYFLKTHNSFFIISGIITFAGVIINLTKLSKLYKKVEEL